jgi:hypothetical protein
LAAIKKGVEGRDKPGHDEIEILTLALFRGPPPQHRIARRAK